MMTGKQVGKLCTTTDFAPIMTLKSEKISCAAPARVNDVIPVEEPQRCLRNHSSAWY